MTRRSVTAGAEGRVETELEVSVPADGAQIAGTLAVPPNAVGIVVFAHGSGSSRFSPRNRFVAHELKRGGLATLLLDLLTAEEEEVDVRTREKRFDIGLLADRLVAATDWLRRRDDTRDLSVGYFGSSTGGGAALVAAAERPADVAAVVSRGGRPDLAGDALGRVRSPTLLIVGGADHGVIELNEGAARAIETEKRIHIVEGATHLFEEPGALDEVAAEARDWFVEHLGGAR